MSAERQKHLWREASARYKARNLERVKRNRRLRNRANPEAKLRRHQRWYQKHKDSPVRKEKDLALARRSYKPRREKQILAITGGRPRPTICEVCGLTGRIFLDHCHTTGKFRGWLCSHCNSALGFAQDNPATLRQLAAYMEASWST